MIRKTAPRARPPTDHTQFACRLPRAKGCAPQDGAESVGKGIAQQYSNVLQVGNNIGQRPEVAETEVILCFTVKKRRCVATLDEWITIYIHNYYRQIVCLFWN